MSTRRVTRGLLLLGVVGLLGLSSFSTWFLVSGFWRPGRSLAEALGDFTFALDTLLIRDCGKALPEPTESRYREALSHLTERADSEPRRFAEWRLARWGLPVAPALLDELQATEDTERRIAIVRILGGLRHAPARPVLAAMLRAEIARVPDAKDRRTSGEKRFERVLIEALDAFREPALAELFVDRLRVTPADHASLRKVLLAAIGRSGGGADALLRLSRSEPALELIEPLGLTRDPRAVRFLLRALGHGRYEVRLRAARALSHCPDAVDPVLSLLERSGDDFLRELIVSRTLSASFLSARPEAIASLRQMLGDPVLRPAAVTALTAADSPESIAALRPSLEWTDPIDVVRSLREASRWGPSLLVEFLDHPQRGVRSQAVTELSTLDRPEALERLARVHAEDPNPHLRRYARDSMLIQDKFRLHRSTLDSLGLPFRRWSWWEPPWSDIPFVLRALHVAGVSLSAVVALLLVFGRLRPFERDRFHFYTVALLVEGILGDFLVFDESYRNYAAATAIRLVHLVAHALRPSRSGGRFERLAGASLWIVVPVILWTGTPTLVAALRAALREHSFFLATWALAGLVLVLGVFVLLPWFRSFRSVRAVLVGATTGSLMTLVVIALVFHIVESARDGQIEHVLVGALLLLPIAARSVGSAVGARVRRWRTPELPAGTPKTLRVVEHGPVTSVRLRRRRCWPLALVALAGFGMTLGVASAMAAEPERWGTGEALGGLLGGAIGVLVTLFGIGGVLQRQVVQVRGGLVRHGSIFLGGVLTSAPWRRTLPRAVTDELEPAECDWIAEVAASSASGAARREVELVEAVG